MTPSIDIPDPLPSAIVATPLWAIPELPTPIRRVGAEPVIERDRGRGQRGDEQFLALPTVGPSGGCAVPKVN